jgi:hypothetical protein
MTFKSVSLEQQKISHLLKFNSRLKRFDFLDFSSMKLSSLIWCIVGCRIPSDEIFAEKYETKIMRREIFMDPTLCFIFHFVSLGSNARPYLRKVFSK